MNIPYLHSGQGNKIEDKRAGDESGMIRNQDYYNYSSYQSAGINQAISQLIGYRNVDSSNLQNLERSKEGPAIGNDFSKGYHSISDNLPQGNLYNTASSQPDFYQTANNQFPPRYGHENAVIESRGYQTTALNHQQTDYYFKPVNTYNPVGSLPDNKLQNVPYKIDSFQNSHHAPQAINRVNFSSENQELANIPYRLPQNDSDPPPLGKLPDLSKFSFFWPKTNPDPTPEPANELPQIPQDNSLLQNNCIISEQKIPIISSPPQVFLDLSANDPKVKKEIEITIKASRIFNEANLRNSIQITEYKKIVPPFNYYSPDQNYEVLQIAKTNEILDPESQVDTISLCWIDIEKMKDFGRYNQNYTYCIDQLIHFFHIRGWKKSRGDGNCYYRAVISRYLEIIFGFYSDITNGKLFLNILKELDDNGIAQNLDFEFSDSLKSAICWVEALLEMKKNDPCLTFHSILTWLQYVNVDRVFVLVSRLLAYCEYLKRQEELSIFLLDDEPDALVRMILTDKTEAEGLILLLLPAALKVQVVQYNLFSKEGAVSVLNYPEDGEYDIKVNIVRRPGHYDILYTSSEQESDIYCIENASYYYIRS